MILVLSFLLYLLLSFKKIEIKSFKFSIERSDPLKKPYEGAKDHGIRNTRRSPTTFLPNANLREELEFILNKTDSKLGNSEAYLILQKTNTFFYLESGVFKGFCF